MLKILFLLTLSLFSFGAMAERLEVHSVLAPSQNSSSYIVKFMDGRVGFSENKLSNLSAKMVEVEFGDNNQILNLTVIGPVIAPPSFTKMTLEDPYFNYQPTIYSNYTSLQQIIDSFDRRWIDSAQCYDKAHVWSYSENTQYRGNLMKAFLFFSDAYIARYNYPWWFHVAPYALARMNGQIAERVLDPSFYHAPLQFKIWTDLFMKNKVECRVISKYSDYSAHPGEDDCYLMKVDMFFWQPRDLEAFEASNVKKTKFIDWEIRHSFKEAFGYTR